MSWLDGGIKFGLMSCPYKMSRIYELDMKLDTTSVLDGNLDDFEIELKCNMTKIFKSLFCFLCLYLY